MIRHDRRRRELSRIKTVVNNPYLLIANLVSGRDDGFQRIAYRNKDVALPVEGDFLPERVFVRRIPAPPRHGLRGGMRRPDHRSAIRIPQIPRSGVSAPVMTVNDVRSSVRFGVERLR